MFPFPFPPPGAMAGLVPGQFPGPMGFQYPSNDLFGSTSYRYTTPDGKPPLDGKVPTKAADFGAMPPPFMPGGNRVPGLLHPFDQADPHAAPPCPFGPAPAPYWGAPPPPCAPTGPCYPPSSYCTAPPPPPAAPTAPAAAAATWKAPVPPPPPGHPLGSTSEPPEPPVKGNRVKGQLATFPDRSVGYIFPKRNVVLHLFSENLVHKYQNKYNLHSPCIKFSLDKEKYNAQIVPLDMTFEELIDQLDCRTRANYYPPYNKRGQGYPEHLIGIQELCRTEGDTWELGTKIVLGEYNAARKLGDLWSDTDGSAGGSEPKYIVRLPC